MAATALGPSLSAGEAMAFGQSLSMSKRVARRLLVVLPLFVPDLVVEFTSLRLD